MNCFTYSLGDPQLARPSLIVDGLAHVGASLINRRWATHFVIGCIGDLSLDCYAALFVAWKMLLSVPCRSARSFCAALVWLVFSACFVLDLMTSMGWVHHHSRKTLWINLPFLVWLATCSLTQSSDKSGTRLVSCKCLLSGTGVRRRSGEFNSPFSVFLPINDPGSFLLLITTPKPSVSFESH